MPCCFAASMTSVPGAVVTGRPSRVNVIGFCSAILSGLIALSLKLRVQKIKLRTRLQIQNS